MRTGLIGKTLPHSFSPRIHGLLGDDGYQLLEMEEDALAPFFAARAFDGVNVTIPYKQKVMPLLDEIDEKALSIGAVNTVVNRNGKLYGYNTDYDGFCALAERRGIDFSGKRAVVLGSGGTSHTVCAALQDGGTASVRVVSRTGEYDYTHPELYRDAEILVNTTPVGMYPKPEERPIDLSFFPELTGVLDVIYNPRRTALIAQAEQLHIPCCSGLPMLVRQAVAARTLFTGEAVPEQTEQAALSQMYVDTMNLVLIGMPGSGKSTIGKRVAKLLGHPFYDADKVLEKKTGRRIPEIFASEGEAAFRTLETETIAALSQYTGAVIATGGGAVLREENVAALRRNGCIVRLTRDVSMLSTKGRPLSKDLDAVYRMQRERAPYYAAAADISVRNERSVKNTAERIVKLFREAIGNQWA